MKMNKSVLIYLLSVFHAQQANASLEGLDCDTCIKMDGQYCLDESDFSTGTCCDKSLPQD